MFAEDIGLLRNKVFTDMLNSGQGRARHPRPAAAGPVRGDGHGGDFGADEVLHFNGGLFADADVIELTPRRNPQPGRCQRDRLEQRRAVDLRHALRADARPGQALADRRALHQPRRHRDAAEPVVMPPLRREWDAVQGRVRQALGQSPRGLAQRSRQGRRTPNRHAQAIARRQEARQAAPRFHDGSRT